MPAFSFEYHGFRTLRRSFLEYRLSWTEAVRTSLQRVVQIVAQSPLDVSHIPNDGLVPIGPLAECWSPQYEIVSEEEIGTSSDGDSAALRRVDWPPLR
jgi:hypothetical protein